MMVSMNKKLAPEEKLWLAVMLKTGRKLAAMSDARAQAHLVGRGFSREVAEAYVRRRRKR